MVTKAQIKETLPLTAASVDETSQAVARVLEEAGVARRTRLQICLGLEEILLRWLQSGAADREYLYLVERRYGFPPHRPQHAGGPGPAAARGEEAGDGGRGGPADRGVPANRMNPAPQNFCAASREKIPVFSYRKTQGKYKENRGSDYERHFAEGIL